MNIPKISGIIRTTAVKIAEKGELHAKRTAEKADKKIFGHFEKYCEKTIGNKSDVIGTARAFTDIPRLVLSVGNMLRFTTNLIQQGTCRLIKNALKPKV